jgi:hypothetical protein
MMRSPQESYMAITGWNSFTNSQKEKMAGATHILLTDGLLSE